VLADVLSWLLGVLDCLAPEAVPRTVVLVDAALSEITIVWKFPPGTVIS